MFSFVQWDSPLMLVMELALSVAVIAGIMFVVRLAKSRSPQPPAPPANSGGEYPNTDE